MRNNWRSYDITSPSGRRVEVKAAAYLQTWTHDGLFSQIRFDIEPKYYWSPDKGMGSVKKRNCDLYVFCVFTANNFRQPILNLDLWDFYVVATSTLNRETPTQKSISLSSLQRFNPVKTDYANLGHIIETIEL